MVNELLLLVLSFYLEGRITIDWCFFSLSKVDCLVWTLMCQLLLGCCLFSSFVCIFVTEFDTESLFVLFVCAMTTNFLFYFSLSFCLGEITKLPKSDRKVDRISNYFINEEKVLKKEKLTQISKVLKSDADLNDDGSHKYMEVQRYKL